MKPGRTEELTRACRAHVEHLIERGAFERPESALAAGKTALPLAVDPERAGALLTIAARDASAGRKAPTRDEQPPHAVLWSDGPDSLLVFLDAVTVTMGDGVITVTLAVACDQLRETTGKPRAAIAIDLVVGTRERPAGLLAASTPPRGPQLVVDRWGDALVAFAWQTLLDTAAGLAAGAGADDDGAALLPAAWTASADGLSILPQARHPLDRRVAKAVDA